MRIKGQTCIQWTAYLLLLALIILSVFQYIHYIDLAKTTVPFMDYWHWIANFGEKVLNDTITFADYFSSDLCEHIHIQPIIMAINFEMLQQTDFDVEPLVEVGAILRIVMAAALVLFFWFTTRKGSNSKWLFRCLIAFGLFYAVINYNQWEMTTEPFSLGNVYRVANYYFSFLIADQWLCNMEHRSQPSNILWSVAFGLLCAFLTLFVGGAYFVGHLVGIGLAMLWVLINKRSVWKKYFFNMLIWAVISFISAVVYFLMIQRRGTAISMEFNGKDAFFYMLEGVCLFWGSLLIPTQIASQYGTAIVTLFGAFTLVYSFYILIVYLTKHQNGKKMFPAITLMYALVISVAITAGRINSFGISVMMGSRYVVESSIGLFGILWMTYDVWRDTIFFSKSKQIVTLTATGLMTIFLVFSASIQQAHAPNMEVYFNNLEQQMLHLDDYSDEELAGFQSFFPNDIRFCVDFFEENNLSIFKDTPE